MCLEWLPRPDVSHAGKLFNKDKEPYEFVIFWDDLEPRVSGTIEPGQTVEFRESKGLIELRKQYDSIYVRPEETITIHNGIMHRPEE